MFFRRNGAGLPLVTQPIFRPSLSTSYPSRPIPGPCISKPTSFFCTPVSSWAARAVFPREFRLIHANHPPQSCFPGCCVFIDLVPIESHFGLQAQGIACAKSCRKHLPGLSRSAQGLPDGLGRRGREVNFKAVFTGVSGTGNQARNVLNMPASEAGSSRFQSGQIDQGLEDGSDSGPWMANCTY